ncbi:CoA pyrophosphatase [Carnobacteriaceae bacterium zg-ZUI240]|nr:CoA pyrophosphatase [Carnobacteriaceae bacterium zg-ZUI240]
MHAFIHHALANYYAKPLGQQHAYAVLLPLIKNNDSYDILYQVRAHHISQPGEVSFPGGKAEANETLMHTAIRETMEELQLPKDAINIIGEIDYLVHGTRTIHCFVGVIDVPSIEHITPNEEVATLFTVPLSHLIDNPPIVYPIKTELVFPKSFPFERIPNEKAYPFHTFPHTIPFYDTYNGHTIWGMTARFTKQFIDMITSNKN